MSALVTLNEKHNFHISILLMLWGAHLYRKVYFAEQSFVECACDLVYITKDTTSLSKVDKKEKKSKFVGFYLIQVV